MLQAYSGMETVEHFARITLVAEMLGGPKVLPRVEVQKLFDSRTRYRVQSKNHFESGCSDDRRGYAGDQREDRNYARAAVWRSSMRR